MDEYLLVVNKGMSTQEVLDLIGSDQHVHLVHHLDGTDRMCNRSCKGYDHIHLESHGN